MSCRSIPPVSLLLASLALVTVLPSARAGEQDADLEAVFNPDGRLPAALAGEQDDPAAAWVEPMRQVHAKFSGQPGTLALFGDSITVSLAFWAPLAHEPKNLPPAGRAALERVNGFMQPKCWRDWRGPEFGNEGGQTVAWAAERVDAWLKKLNPEVVVLLFGTNDLAAGVTVQDYAATTRRVVRKCLDNGSLVILTTVPPRSDAVEQSHRFAAAARQVAEELNVPLVDYHAEILHRRPNDWDGSKAPFKDESGGDVYNVSTLVSADGVRPSAPHQYGADFSEKALNSHGYNLRSFLTLLMYADVIERILER